jgi:hypothetical protein
MAGGLSLGKVQLKSNLPDKVISVSIIPAKKLVNWMLLSVVLVQEQCF